MSPLVPVLIAIALLFICTAFTVGPIVVLYRATSARREALGPAGDEPVTVLKPLCGADDDLEANLATFFEQTYPNYELLFGVEGENDPAIAVVRTLRRRYPDVRCRLVIHDGGLALNPKVSNLVRTLESGS
ncbi:MAG: glycosyl transferase, partial [Myxococcales bacterium]|nr:glycosyl transferase [Myxococcales bacterium]